MAHVRLDGISKFYGDKQTVKSIDLEIEDKEFMVLVGPSGCGKSTTLRMVAGLEDISSGQLFIDGKDVTHTAPQSRDIAMVFQSYALYPHMTAYRNMAFGLMKTTRMSKPEIDSRVREAAEMLNISGLLERRPSELSGGERQRVAIGRALVRKPKVFLFDEPLSNLDAKLRHRMRGELQRLHRELGITVIYVTHDQVEAMTLGTRVAVMSDGVLQQLGAPMDVYRAPVNRFVATFIGSPEMNLIDCAFDAGHLKHPNFSLPAPARFSALPGSVTLGLRPEEIKLSNETATTNTVAIVQSVELVGAEALVTLQLNGDIVIARCATDDTPQAGTRIGITFDLSKARLYDKISDRLILPTGHGAGVS